MKSLLKLIIPIILFGVVLSPIVGFLPAVLGVVALSSIMSFISIKTSNFKGVAMMAISIQNAHNLLTKMLVATYIERPRPTTFLRSFFPSKFVKSKLMSIEVRRGTEKIAVDVSQYTNGNRNQFSRSTERLITPPFYNEWFSLNEHELYDTVVASISQGNTNNLEQLMEDYQIQLGMIIDKIERAHELQCSNVLETGVISLSGKGAVSEIDYKRKAGSIIAYNAANDFSIGTVSPYDVFEEGCRFLREVGKAQGGGTFNSLLGDEVMSAFLNNEQFLKRNDIQHLNLDDVIPPNIDVTGATYRGTISAGSYKVNLWVYPETYDDAAGNTQSYWPTKKMVILPLVTNFMTAWGLVPQLIDRSGNIPQNAPMLLQDFINEEEGYHKQYVKAAPVVIPVAIDQMYTITILN